MESAQKEEKPRSGDFMELDQFEDRNPYFKKKRVYWLRYILRGDARFMGCFRQINRRLLICESEFLAWVDSQRGSNEK